MANAYFEITDNVVSRFGGKYFTTNTVTGKFAFTSSRLLVNSSRAWIEQENMVWYLKNRQDPTAEVDMKEFMWIKLSAETVHG